MDYALQLQSQVEDQLCKRVPGVMWVGASDVGGCSRQHSTERQYEKMAAASAPVGVEVKKRGEPPRIHRLVTIEVEREASAAAVVGLGWTRPTAERAKGLVPLRDSSDRVSPRITRRQLPER